MIKKYARAIFLLIFFSRCFFSHAQLYVINGSFERSCGEDSTPTSWTVCTGAPDTWPCNGNPSLVPSDGQTYLGLTTKAWGQNEAIQQQLQNRLDSNSCYTLLYDVAYSQN